MELRVLRYFLMLAREGSYTAAASSLHVTQPTLSRQIRDLEEELGQKLIVRGSHSVKLTPEGMLLRKRAEEIISMVDKTEAEFSAMEEIIAGTIYIGGGETKGIAPVARILKAMQADYPGIRCHLYSGNAADVTERLDKGLLDFGILIGPADLSKYDYVDLPDKDIWGVVMRKDSPLAGKERVKPGDLVGLPLICSRQAMEQTSSLNEYVEWFGKDYEKLNVVTTFNLFYNAAIMVDAGIGYALTIDRLANTSELSTLCFRPLEPRLESRLNIVWKKYQVFSSAAQLFLETIQEQFAFQLY